VLREKRLDSVRERHTDHGREDENPVFFSLNTEHDDDKECSCCSLSRDD